MSAVPQGWKRRTIGSVCQLLNGRAFKPSDWTTQGLPIVRIQNLNDPTAPFNYYDGEVRPRFLIESGDLLFAWSGTPGTSFGAHVWNGGPAILNQHIFNVVFDKDVVEKHFLKWAINHKLDELIDKAHGGVGLRHVTKGKVEETEIDVPPMMVQRHIIAKLQETESRLRRARHELDRGAKMVVRCTQAILTAAFEEAERACDRPTSLAEISTSVRNGLSRKPAASPPGIPILRISAVRSRRVDLRARRFYVPEESEDIAAFDLIDGDLLFTRYNGNPDLVAVCGVVRGISERMVYPDKLIRVRLLPQVLPEFVELMFSSATMRLRLARFIKTAAGQHGISGKDLKSVPFPLPSVGVQRVIVEKANGRAAKVTLAGIETNRAKSLIERLEAAVLAKAFRGELLPSTVGAD